MKTGQAFPSDYLRAADLNGSAVRVTIDTVTMEKMGDDHKPVLHFIGKHKGVVLNKTNAARIEEATGTDEMDDWHGWSITLYPCKVDYQGKRVDAIRVDDRPGATRPPAKAAAKAAKPVVVDDEAPPDFEPIDIPDDEIPF